MFLDMNAAVQAIMQYIKRSLGPITGAEKGGVSFQTAAAEFGVQLVSTIILFLVVAFFFWKPITKILEERRAVIDKELTDAKNAKEQTTLLQIELERQLNDAKAQVKALLDQAEKDGNAKREEIINGAKEEARRRLDSLELELAQEKSNMEKEIKNEIVEIAFAAAEKIVSKEINREKYMDVIDDILKEAK